MRKGKGKGEMAFGEVEQMEGLKSGIWNCFPGAMVMVGYGSVALGSSSTSFRSWIVHNQPSHQGIASTVHNGWRRQ